jgi:predicted negative regulator of RcsB-dependent stress response
MDANATEEQQIEAFKKWWKENGSSIITGLLLGLAILFGARSWFAYQERSAENASDIYTSLMAALTSGDTLAVTQKAGMLIADFSGTPYASLAAMAVARVKLEEDELEAARAQLQWALDNAGSDVIRETARLRLVRVLIAEGKYAEAEAMINQAEASEAFEPLYRELRGDIHFARGDTASARAEYEHALAAMTPDMPERQLVQLKYDNAAMPEAGGAGE